MAGRQVSINLATLRGAGGFAAAVEACLRHDVTAIGPWRDQVEAVGLREAARIVKANGLRVTGLCRGGMFPGADAEARNRAHEDNLRAIDEATVLGADCLVLVCGGLPPGSRDLADARRQVADGIAAILPHARAAKMPLAIEPLHPIYAADRSCISTLDEALDLCEVLGEGTGVAIDAYHVWWDPKLGEAIARAGRLQAILAHHICDWLVPTRDLLLDRGMMGDGVIDLVALRAMINAAGFTGPEEVEIFSAENWWKRPPDEVVRTVVERFETAC